MKKIYWLLLLGITLFINSCQSTYKVIKVEGRMLPVDSTWDAKQDPEAVALLAPYKAKIDSVMYQVIGMAAVTLEKKKPESPLANLVADVLRTAAVPTLGKPADMGLINMNGLRNILSKGPITYGDVFEILPFENTLCIVTLKGSELKQLFENIAAERGNGVSGVQMKITTDGALLEGSVSGKPIEYERLYTVATIDYLVDGNDGMLALKQAEKRICPPKSALRDLFLKYVEQQTASGKAISAPVEGRVVLVEEVHLSNR